MKAGVYSANAMNRGGSRCYCGRRIRRLPASNICGRDAGFGGEDGGMDRAEKKLASSVKLSRRQRKPAAKSSLVARAEQWSHEGVVVDR